MTKRISEISFRTVRLESYSETGALLASATGFFCNYKGSVWLVTNWHIVSGRNQNTGVALHGSLALPNKIHILFLYEKNDGQLASDIDRGAASIELYEEGEPCWLEHPVFADKVDVVAIPVDIEFLDLFPVSTFSLDVEMASNELNKLWIMDRVFIVGFPLSEDKANSVFPIYKSGTIASEPDFYLKEPMFYVDGKTKSGMSGSPVVRGQGVRFEESENDIRTRVLATTLIGIYSGRDRQEKTEFEAELGIVWPVKECLIPILESKVKTKRT